MQELRQFVGQDVLNSFRLMSYNILADSLIEIQDKQRLNWKQRSKAIYEEIISQKPDIVCIQELDQTESELKGYMSQYYKHQYIKRSDDKQDGCALFFRQDRFTLIDNYSLYLQQEKIDHHFLDRPNVCLLVVLQDNVTKKNHIIAVTHLLFNIKRGDIKLLQLQIITKALQLLKTKFNDASITLCGDFNLIPSSAIYSYLSNGQYDFSNEDMRNLSGQSRAHFYPYDYLESRKQIQKLAGTYSNRSQFEVHNDLAQPRWTELMSKLDCRFDDQGKIEIYLNNAQPSLDVELPIKLVSAYASCQRQNKNNLLDFYAPWATYEPLITTMTKTQVGCVDYVWTNLGVAKILQVPHIKVLTKHGLEYPSDHLPLVQFFRNRAPFQKRLVNSSLLNQSDEVLLDDLLFLISCFENNHTEFLSKAPSFYMLQYFELSLEEYQLFTNQNFREFSSHYLVRNKILLTSHLMLHEFQIGVEFADHFLAQKFQSLLKKDFIKQPKSQAQIENWLTANVQLSYYLYLQKLAVNIQVFHSCKIQQYPLLADGQRYVDVQTKLLWLFKISNLVNGGLGQMQLLKEALKLVPDDLLLKEIVLVYWSDIIVFYNFLSKEILQLIDYYRHLATQVCLQFYELYTQLFQIRNSILEIYQFRSTFDRDHVIKQPKWFDINKPLQREIEEFVFNQKMQIGGLTERGQKKTTRSTLQTAGNEIKTHRPLRQFSNPDSDENFQHLTKILVNENLQNKLTHKKQKINQQIQQ